VLLCGLELCWWQGILPVQDVIHEHAPAARLGAAPPSLLEANLKRSTQQWHTRQSRKGSCL
jgi:hypothetical protein